MRLQLVPVFRSVLWSQGRPGANNRGARGKMLPRAPRDNPLIVLAANPNDSPSLTDAEDAVDRLNNRQISGQELAKKRLGEDRASSSDKS